MAGGPLFPHSAVPVDTALVFPRQHVGAGGNSDEEDGLGLAAATLGADAIWRLRFKMPPTLPSGTGKLDMDSLANATAGVVNVNPKWASVTAEEDPSSATLNAEGTTAITWSAGDADVYKNTKITLDADTLVGGETVVMDLVFENTGTTLAVESSHVPSIIWE